MYYHFDVDYLHSTRKVTKFPPYNRFFDILKLWRVTFSALYFSVFLHNTVFLLNFEKILFTTTMGFLDFLFGTAKNIASNAAHDAAYSAARRAMDRAMSGSPLDLGNSASGTGFGGMQADSHTINIIRIPRDLDDMKALPQASLSNEFDVAALCVAVLANFETDRNATIEMLNYLRGPRPLSNYDVQFLSERLSGKPYKMMSFFNGSSPDNEYTPSQPLTITVASNPYSYQNEGYATLWLRSSGADSPMPLSLRKKPSTGQWFVWEITCLADVREPASQDPWK